MMLYVALLAGLSVIFVTLAAIVATSLARQFDDALDVDDDSI